MKTTIFIVISLALIGVSLCAQEQNFLNKEGSATNMGTDNVEAISYALAKEMKTDDFYVQNSKDYKAPLLVERLPPKMPLGGGEITTVDEIASPEDYYDGTRGLKTTVVSCQQYTTQPEVCMHQGACGWCGSSANCITGNNLGPLAPCLRGTYKFTAPGADWNTMNTNDYSSNKMNIGGAQLTKIFAK